MVRTKRRKRGQHDPEGVTKLIIIEYVYNNVTGVPTPDIQGYLRKERNVSVSKGIRVLLNSLESKQYIKGTHKKGLESIWYPPDTVDHISGLLSDRKLWSASRLKKKPIEDALVKLKEAHKAQDLTAVETATNELNQIFQAASEEMYKTAQASEPTSQPEADQTGNNDTKPGNEEVTDVDFEEVK